MAIAILSNFKKRIDIKCLLRKDADVKFHLGSLYYSV